MCTSYLLVLIYHVVCATILLYCFTLPFYCIVLCCYSLASQQVRILRTPPSYSSLSVHGVVCVRETRASPSFLDLLVQDPRGRAPFLRIRAEFCAIFGEPDVKQGRQRNLKMRGSEIAEAMAVAVDCLVSAHEGTSALDRAIEATIDKIGRFIGKDATSYLEAYRGKMQMRNIPEDRQWTGYPRIMTRGINAEVLEVQAGCRDWADFAERILEQYNFDDSLRLSKKAFMDWVDNPNKGWNTSVLL